MASDADCTMTTKNVHTIHSEQLTERLKNYELFLDIAQTIKLALENAPLSNEVESKLSQIQSNISNYENEIKSLKSKINTINEIKELFKEKLSIPDDDRNDNFNTEHLLLSVPLYNDNDEKVTFSHFWLKLVCFAKHHKLSHFAIKQCLDCVLQANAFDVFNFIREKPFSECVEILQNHFATVETVQDNIKKLETIRRKPNQKIQSFLAQVSILLLKTQSLFPTESQAARYESKMIEYLLKYCSDRVRPKLQSYRADSIRNGYVCHYSELFSLCKDLEEEIESSKSTSSNHTFMINGGDSRNIPSITNYRNKCNSIGSIGSSQTQPSRQTSHSASSQTQVRPSILEARFNHRNRNAPPQTRVSEVSPKLKISESTSNNNSSAISNISGTNSKSNSGSISSMTSSHLKRKTKSIINPSLYPELFASLKPIFDKNSNSIIGYINENDDDNFNSMNLNVNQYENDTFEDDEDDYDYESKDNDDELEDNSDDNMSVDSEKESFLSKRKHDECAEYNLTTLTNLDLLKKDLQPKLIIDGQRYNGIYNCTALYIPESNKQTKQSHENEVLENNNFQVNTLSVDNNDNRFMIQMNIPLEGLMIPADSLIDTGSALSLAKREFLDSFPSYNLDYSDCNYTLSCLSTTNTQVTQKVHLDLIVQNKGKKIAISRDFYIVEDCPVPFDLLIGQDILTDYLSTIDYEVNQITFIKRDELGKVKTFVDISTDRPSWKNLSALVAVESLKLSPSSKSVIKCKLLQNSTNIKENEHFEAVKHPQSPVICRKEKFKNKAYQIFTVCIKNPSEFEVQLESGDPIATITPTSSILEKNTTNNAILETSISNNDSLTEGTNVIDLFGETISYHNFAKLQNEDEYCSKIKLKSTLPNSYKLMGDILFKTINKDCKMVLPKSNLLKVIDKLHLNDENGHCYRSDIIKLLHKQFYRPDMGKITKAHLRNCKDCSIIDNIETKSSSDFDSSSSENKSMTYEESKALFKAEQSKNESFESNDNNNMVDELIIKQHEQHQLPTNFSATTTHPRQAWHVDLVLNLKPSRHDYSCIFIFKDLHSNFRILCASKDPHGGELYKHLRCLIRCNGRPKLLQVSKTVNDIMDISLFCVQKNITFEVSNPYPGPQHFDSTLKTLISSTCESNHKWIYLVPEMQDYINYTCLNFLGQKESPQTIHIGPYYDMRGIPTNTNSINDLIRSWSEYMSKVNNERTGDLKPKTKVQHMFQEKSNEYFSLGEPVFFETWYFDERKQSNKPYLNGPFQVVKFHGSNVVLRDLSKPYQEYNQFVQIEKLLKVKTPFQDGITLSEFEIQLIQNNSLPDHWLIN